ncbi:MAG: DNA gyrase subunit A [Chloroflexi bacterium]|nr:DNA gyrase subunit A [Chloroflexota bacterium]
MVVERLVNLEEEMRVAYLDYAMSVIVARALPDVRDGLKPVQRRILYTMQEMGLRANQAYRKSAGIVGEVMGKYHPHGDAPIYDSLVRLAQDFSLRYPLVDGQGNFGSIDNDPPAAMRYTEARLSAIAAETLVDIDRDTVDFVPNYDGRAQEPVVLPARLPNLLVNGASGIAVGMATNIPPHNLSEVCDAIVHCIDHWDGINNRIDPAVEVADLLRFIQGPDFPTGGIIQGRGSLLQTYSQGQGRVVVRAKASIEEGPRGQRPQIIITEIPYQVNKATLVEKIAVLARDKKVDGIAEVRDESDREGLRIAIDLRRDATPEVVLNNLYEHTTLQSAFNVNVVALVDGQPRVLGLRPLLEHYINFRREVITRRSQYDLRRARDRAHVLEGLKVALDNLDAIIALIRRSESPEEARAGLMGQFTLSQRQAQAILEMQLRRLAALERRAVLEELDQVHSAIAELEALLADPAQILASARQEVVALKEEQGDARRTEISEEEPAEFRREDLIPHQEVVVTLSHRGYIKRVLAESYRIQRRGGRGIAGMVTREEDAVQHLRVCDTHDALLFFTNTGRVISLRCFDLPDASRMGKGIPLANLVSLDPTKERITTLLSTSEVQDGHNLVLATRKGGVKRTPLKNFVSVRSTGIIAMKLKQEDELVSVRIAEENGEVILVTERGQAVRILLKDLPSRSRTSGGVRGMKLGPGDRVVSMDTVDPEGELLVVTTRGFGKMSPVDRYSFHYRRGKSWGGKGLLTFRILKKTGPVVGAVSARPDQELILVSKKGIIIRTTLGQIPVQGRSTQGVTVMNLREDDEVASLSCL